VFISQRSSYDAAELHKVHKINKIEYSKDIEVRESGTPNIVGIIKIGTALTLKKTYQRIIRKQRVRVE
jgi:hypothetical protein